MCLKTPVIFNFQQFNNSKSEETVPIVYKYQRFDKRNNKEGQNLNKYKSNSDSDKYISFPLISLLLLSQKGSNRPSDLGENIKSLT